jgi:chitinase
MKDNVIDVFPIAFLQKFFGTGGAPEINLANVRTVSPLFHHDSLERQS